MHLRKYCTKTGYVHILRLKVSWGARVCVCASKGKLRLTHLLRLNLYLTLKQS